MFVFGVAVRHRSFLKIMKQVISSPCFDCTLRALCKVWTIVRLITYLLFFFFFSSPSRKTWSVMIFSKPTRLIHCTNKGQQNYQEIIHYEFHKYCCIIVCKLMLFGYHFILNYHCITEIALKTCLTLSAIQKNGNFNNTSFANLYLAPHCFMSNHNKTLGTCEGLYALLWIKQ